VVDKWLLAWLQNSAAMSFLIIAFLLLMQWQTRKRKYSAKWLYYTWLVIVIGLLIPLRPQFLPALFPIESSHSHAVRTSTVSAHPPNTTNPDASPLYAVESIQGEEAEQDRESRGASLFDVDVMTNAMTVAGYVWLIGIAAFLLPPLVRHRIFMKLVKRWSSPVTEASTLAIMEQVRAELSIVQPVTLKSCSFIAGPMLIGFTKPVILLPNQPFTAAEWSLICKHELVHWKRKDLWYKSAVLVVTAIHWFNPLVHLMARSIASLCEQACDEAVIGHSDLERRKLYGAAIIGVVRNHAQMSTAFSTTFYGGRQEMKRRLSFILDSSKKRKGITVLSCVLLGTIASGAVFAAGGESQGQSQPQTEQQERVEQQADQQTERQEGQQKPRTDTAFSASIHTEQGMKDYEKLLGKDWEKLSVLDFEDKLAQIEADQFEGAKKSAAKEGVSISYSPVTLSQIGQSASIQIWNKDALGDDYEIKLDWGYTESIKDKSAISVKEKERLIAQQKKEVMNNLKRMIGESSYKQLKQPDMIEKLKAELEKNNAKPAALLVNLELLSFSVDGKVLYQKEAAQEQESQPQDRVDRQGFRVVELDHSFLDMDQKNAAELEHELHLKYRGQNVIVAFKDFEFVITADDVTYFPSYSFAEHPEYIVKVTAKYTIFDHVSPSKLTDTRVGEIVGSILKGKHYQRAADLELDVLEALKREFGVKDGYFTVDTIAS